MSRTVRQFASPWGPSLAPYSAAGPARPGIGVEHQVLRIVQPPYPRPPVERPGRRNPRGVRKVTARRSAARGDRLQELGHPSRFPPRWHALAARDQGLQPVPALHAVDLVEGQHRRPVAHTELAQDALDGLRMLLQRRMAGVHYVHQDVGVLQLLERGPKGGDQLVGQLADEADRVGQDERPLSACSTSRAAGSRVTKR